jgi:hypothetical protein
MEFSVPQDLTKLSPAALAGLIEVASAEFSALKETVTAETVTDEQLADMAALQKFTRVDAPAAIAAYQARQDQFAALTAEPTAPTGQPPAPAAEPVITPTIADIIDAGTQPPQTVVAPDAAIYSSFVASAGVPGFEGGQKLTNLLDVAKAFEARSAGHAGMAGRGGNIVSMSPVAQLVRDYPEEFSMQGDITDYPKLLKIIDERRLPGGSLLASDKIARTALAANPQPGRDVMVASAGWCAPSETDYTICLQIATDGMLNVPEVQARRGGVRHNTGLDFAHIFGTCVSGGPYANGYFNLSEAQVAAGVTKTCLEIPCPDFVDTRLGVTGLCLTGNILANRGYPEYTETFTRGALAVSAHQINSLQIAAIVAGSTAVTLTGNQPWVSDASVVSQVMSAVDMAIMDIKYALRAEQGATLEVILPFWVLAQFRADWLRRQHALSTNAGDILTLTDDAIRQGFADRGARVQFVYDWQDAFSTCAVSGSLGSSTPLTQLPTSLQFLVYPAGTWVRAVQNVITLNSIYDSTKLVTNQVTQLFTEDGWAMLRMCTTSRVYTINICPTGSTGAAHTIVCA